jgi:hypothetical protein
MQIKQRFSHGTITIHLLIFQHIIWFPLAFLALERHPARQCTIVMRKRAKENLIPPDLFDKTQHSLLSRLSAASGISLSETTINTIPTSTCSGSSSLSTTEEKEYKVGVLFLNLGGPTTGEDVEGNVMHQRQGNTDEEVWFLK